ncbi:unnamed protein product [Didymodactylos carnosus]|uniref:Tetratricopeptide repeat protein n=1 Tax=Didymodactylos carnosus TaxID=1234261 RepID=A0A8S2EKU2_9BILA|nr:unnamed protein product [Didymodactylos carnosus]CAF3985984.1 unnamed protein product [Didymodactylos carnosus]
MCCFKLAVEYLTKAVSLLSNEKIHENMNLNDKIYIFQLYFALGSSYYKLNEYDLCILYYRKALVLNLVYNRSVFTLIYKEIGFSFWNKYEFDLAIEYYNKILELEQQQILPNRILIAHFKYLMNICFTLKEAYDLSVLYNIEKDEIKLDDKVKIGHYNWECADYSKQYCQFDLSIKFYLKALKIFENCTNRKAACSKICASIGDIYYKNLNYDQALVYCTKSLDLVSKEADLTWYTYDILSSIYCHYEDKTLAYNCILKALKLLIKSDKSGLEKKNIKHLQKLLKDCKVT